MNFHTRRDRTNMSMKPIIMLYRNDIDIDNRTNVTSYTNLYDSRFYAVNDEFKV